MSDDKGPVFRRARPQRSRDEYVEKHSIPDFVDEEATGKHTGPELARLRARRPTPERISRLEEKHDALALSVSKMDGKLDTLVDLAGAAAAEREKRAAAEAVALERRRKHVIALIGAIGVAVAGIVAAGVV